MSTPNLDMFKRTLLQLLTSIERLPDATCVEVEIRLALEERDFLRRFTACKENTAAGKMTLAETISSTKTAQDGTKYRVERCSTSACVLSNIVKKRILPRAIDFDSNSGRLRLDAQVEMDATPAADSVVGIVHVRSKKRISFNFVDALSWRIDFTRVKSDSLITHELEIELNRNAIPDASPLELVEQLLRVLRRLHIFIS